MMNKLHKSNNIFCKLVILQKHSECDLENSFFRVIKNVTHEESYMNVLITNSYYL